VCARIQWKTAKNNCSFISVAEGCSSSAAGKELVCVRVSSNSTKMWVVVSSFMFGQSAGYGGAAE
jgi:hypothetical protein